MLTFLEVGFGGNLVQWFGVYAWRAVPSFPQIAPWGPSFTLWPQPLNIFHWKASTRSRLPWGHRATNNISVFVDLTIGGEADVNKDQRGGGGLASRHNITSCIKCLDDNTVLLDNAIMLKPDYFIFTRNNRHKRVNVGAESHKYVWDDRELSKYKGKKCKVSGKNL